MRDVELNVVSLVCSHEYAAAFKRPSRRRNNLLSCLSASSQGFIPTSELLDNPVKMSFKTLMFSVYQLFRGACTNINATLDELLRAAKAGVSSADPRAAVIKGCSLQVSQRRK